MREIAIILKKELARVFGDKKLIFSLFILPAILMIGIYSLMGIFMDNMQEEQEQHISKVYMQNAPEEFQTFIQSTIGDLIEVELKTTDTQEISQEIKDKILNSELDLAVSFAPNFLESIQAYQTGSAIPEVQTYYNPSGDYSENTRTMFLTQLETYRNELLASRVNDFESLLIFTIDSSFQNEENAIFDERVASGKVVAMILPYLITLLLFAGVMSLGTDTITGEKERGTMATMLITPIKRSSIVFGKLFALMILSAISAAVYAVSMIVAMPMMAKGFGDMAGLSFSLDIEQIIMILLIIVSLVFVYVGLVAITSVYAKTMKEASTYVMPAYLIVIICGMMTMFVTGTSDTTNYFVPIYGSSMALRNILTQEISMVQCLIAVATNLVCGGVISFVLTKAFNSEKVMFNA